jgi:hypothetical protein
MAARTLEDFEVLSNDFLRDKRDGAIIPRDESNRDYREYLRLLNGEEANTADPLA